MAWHESSITPGELDALREAARQAWAEDSRYPLTLLADRPDRGQCYVTAHWLVSRLGGCVGKAGGHYAWMSHDHEWVIDLTEDHGHGEIYNPNNGRFSLVSAPVNRRARHFATRANQIFENLDKLLKLGLDYMGDGLPAEESQRADDIAQQQMLHDEPAWEPQTTEYRFVYANGQLEVSGDHSHDELSGHAKITPDHTGPMAMGHIILAQNKATWEVNSNMNIAGIARIFKDYTKHVGWEWGGLTNGEGEPISDEFAPKKGKTLHWVYDQEKDHLWLGRASSTELALRMDSDGRPRGSGVARIYGGRAYISPVLSDALGPLAEWADDQGFILYAGNDNVLKTIEDLELGNRGDNKNTLDPQQPQPGVSDYDEREPSGVYKCPACNRLFPNWNEYQAHRRDEENSSGEMEEDGGFPESDMDATFPSHFTEMQPFVMPIASTEAARVDGFNGDDEGEFYVAYHFGSPVGYAHLKEGKLVEIVAHREGAKEALQEKVMKYAEKQPKDLLEESIPFLYDIDEDTVIVGHPGQRTSDIPGQFTPGGIVEGTYEPGGKVVFRTMTNMPYSLNHVVALWYYQHPELSVTGMELQDDKGGRTKLAADDIGGYIKSLVASDPTAYAAVNTLEEAGGNVYAVGGAVRDAIKGQEPKDIDLMVSGLESPRVQAALNQLPGRVDLTGRSFGVFRYRDGEGEVEIALPRQEYSTGAGHKDFSVNADPHLAPEEDLFRRDFTANAMAVDLSNGRLIDPYNGRDDIQQGILRAHNPDALREDPLRVVRALVAHGRHGLVPDDGTKTEMARNADQLEHLPQERIQAELDKLFSSKDPAAAIRLAQQTGTLQHILPEVASAFGFDQNNPHHELELGDHLTNVLDRVSQKTLDPDLRLAGLLHDIGKPASAWTDPERGSNHYYEKHMPDGTVLGKNHEDVGADMTRALMNRLRYPKDRIDRVTDLVQHHMWDPFTTPKGARKFLQRVGPHADDLLTLRWGDQGGKSEYPTKPEVNLDTQRNLLEQVRNAQSPTQRSQLAINGNDLIQAGVPAGPEIGKLLEQLTNAVVDDPTLNEPKKLLTMAQRMLYSHGS